MIIVKSENIQWINNLRVIATISVIFLHVAAELPTLYSKIPDDKWWVGNFYDSAVRFCVPLFLMISGALLLGKKINTIEFIKKRFIRVLLPFLFWSIIYVILNVIFKIYTNEKFNVLEYILRQLHYGSANHMWFVYMILGIYLFMPIINEWIINAKTQDIFYYLILWMFTLFIALPYKSNVGFSIDLYYFSGYLGYVVLGNLLFRINYYSFFYNRYNFVLLYIIGFSITLFGTFFLTKNSSVFIGSLYEYLSPNVLLMAVGVFLFIKSISFKNEFLLKLINQLSKYSYGIFLVHILILILLRKLSIYWDSFTPIFSIPLVTFLCLLISFITVYSINRIPFGKYISG